MTLLALPDTVLSHVLGRLTSAADLARCAAACTALRALVASHRWPGAAELKVHVWSPLVRQGLAWAAERCPSLVHVDFSGMGACSPEELRALSTLRGLRQLALRDCWRLEVGTGGERVHSLNNVAM